MMRVIWPYEIGAASSRIRSVSFARGDSADGVHAFRARVAGAKVMP